MLVKHEHARILREALAHCANYGTPTIRERAMKALGQYAQSLKDYCEHPNRSAIQNMLVCIDCGKAVRNDN